MISSPRIESDESAFPTVNRKGINETRDTCGLETTLKVFHLLMDREGAFIPPGPRVQLCAAIIMAKMAEVM